MKGDVFIQEISEYRHSFLPECPRIRSSTGYTCLQEQLTERKQKKCCQSVNKRCREKEREEKTDKCKVFCVTSTRNNRNSEHQNN